MSCQVRVEALLIGRFVGRFINYLNGPQLRNVGPFEALFCPPVTKIATKNEPFGNHCPPNVFLGAVSKRFYLPAISPPLYPINLFLESIFPATLGLSK